MSFNRGTGARSSATQSRIANLRRQLIDLERRKNSEVARLQKQVQDTARRFDDQVNRTRQEIMRLEGTQGFSSY